MVLLQPRRLDQRKTEQLPEPGPDLLGPGIRPSPLNPGQHTTVELKPQCVHRLEDVLFC